MTQNEILQLSAGIFGLLMIFVMAFSASEMGWIYPKLSRWLEKRKKKREQRRRAAEVKRILSS